MGKVGKAKQQTPRNEAVAASDAPASPPRQPVPVAALDAPATQQPAETAVAEETPPLQTRENPPPIWYDVSGGKDWDEHLSFLDHVYQHDWRRLKIVDNGRTAVVWARSWSSHEEARKRVVEHLVQGGKTLAEAEEEWESSVWTPKARRKKSKPQKYLIRGLPWLVSEEEVRVSLERLGVKAKVTLHQKSNQGKPPLFIIHAWRGDGKQAPAPSCILSITEMLGVEVLTCKLPAHLDGPPQCYRCQAFGHIAKHCRAVRVCVACGGPHRRSACTLREEDPPRCHNCGGGHVASWRGCPASLSAKRSFRSMTARGSRATKQPAERRSSRGNLQSAAPAGGSYTTARQTARRRQEMAGEEERGSAPPATPTTTRRGRRGGKRARQRAANQSAPSSRREQERPATDRPQESVLDAAILAAIDAAVHRAVSTAVQAAIKEMLPLIQQKQ